MFFFTLHLHFTLHFPEELDLQVTFDLIILQLHNHGLESESFNDSVDRNFCHWAPLQLGVTQARNLKTFFCHFVFSAGNKIYISWVFVRSTKVNQNVHANFRDPPGLFKTTNQMEKLLWSVQHNWAANTSVFCLVSEVGSLIVREYLTYLPVCFVLLFQSYYQIHANTHSFFTTQQHSRDIAE